jgi:hypothetical protein
MIAAFPFECLRAGMRNKRRADFRLLKRRQGYPT